jgi:hypothetical protein
MEFIDIVGSTALATELGDARWKELLTRFRRVVRAELKRFGGREQDTAGDGFFATFAEPAQGLRAAVSVAGAVQELGVDVRAGVHTGETEEMDGSLGGIAVHVAARVMSLAGPAEVLVTSTGRLVAREPASGKSRVSIPLGADPCRCKIAFGFGSVWLAKNVVAVYGGKAGTSRWVIQRIDELSGKRETTFRLPADAVFGAIATGGGAVWVLQTDGTLMRIDPSTNRVVARYTTGAVETNIQAAAVLDGVAWIAAGPVVDRVEISNGRKAEVAMPKGVWAGGIAADPVTRTLWIKNGGRPSGAA